MNGNRIQEVIDIEKRAQAMVEAARKEAELLPRRADEESRELVANARRTAEEEAAKILEAARSADSAEQILAAAQESMGERRKLAEKNLERAVAYVVDRVLGKA